MSKSHVSIAQHQCVVCGTLYDTGEILFDQRLRQNMEKYTTTGQGFCPEHLKMKNDGFIALVEVDETRKNRTGPIAHVKSEVWQHLFNIPIPPHGVAHVEVGVIDMLRKKQIADEIYAQFQATLNQGNKNEDTRTDQSELQKPDA